jgi:hypothetical protein
MAIKVIEHNGKTTYLGITAEAERLGVSRTHLWLVLTGQRESKQLKKRIKIEELG